ncbi:MAG: hypothetical protein H0X49_04830 [Acidobacteria bacterium]|nr:hypothetical protein [Acidobacteriota bacterium]
MTCFGTCIRFRSEGLLALFGRFPLRVTIPDSVVFAMQARTERIVFFPQISRSRRPIFDELLFEIWSDTPTVKDNKNNSKVKK